MVKVTFDIDETITLRFKNIVCNNGQKLKFVVESLMEQYVEEENKILQKRESGE